MSRRKLQWKRSIAQAGGDANKVIPQNTKGRGIRGTGVPKELWGELSKPGEGKGATCTAGMKPETESKFRNSVKGAQ